jgi:hypothetical protein
MGGSNHIVNAQGRGACYSFMMAGETQDVVNRAQRLVDSGFEVFIYLIEPSKTGQPSFTPEGALNLRRVYHLFDASEKYHDEVKSIIDGLCAHSIIASKKYINEMIEEFNKELVNLTQLESMPNNGEPPTGS